MKEINNENFNEVVLESEKPVILDVYAHWCQPCKVIAPIFEELSSENKNIEFVKCNIDDNPEIATRYSIRSIPTIMYFNKGELLDIQVGAAPKSSFLNKINKLYENV